MLPEIGQREGFQSGIIATLPEESKRGLPSLNNKYGKTPSCILESDTKGTVIIHARCSSISFTNFVCESNKDQTTTMAEMNQHSENSRVS